MQFCGGLAGGRVWRGAPWLVGLLGWGIEAQRGLGLGRCVSSECGPVQGERLVELLEQLVAMLEPTWVWIVRCIGRLGTMLPETDAHGRLSSM
jgi:hypothetical protein